MQKCLETKAKKLLVVLLLNMQCEFPCRVSFSLRTQSAFCEYISYAFVLFLDRVSHIAWVT